MSDDAALVAGTEADALNVVATELRARDAATEGAAPTASRDAAPATEADAQPGVARPEPEIERNREPLVADPTTTVAPQPGAPQPAIGRPTRTEVPDQAPVQSQAPAQSPNVDAASSADALVASLDPNAAQDGAADVAAEARQADVGAARDPGAQDRTDTRPPLARLPGASTEDASRSAPDNASGAAADPGTAVAVEPAPGTDNTRGLAADQPGAAPAAALGEADAQQSRGESASVTVQGEPALPEAGAGGPAPEATAPEPARVTFTDIGLSEPVLRAIADMGYRYPTPIQEQAIPQVLMTRDVLGVAQTGTGKTAGFTLPMLDILAGSRARARMPRSLILEPTRELALQVAENFVQYGKYLKLTHALIIGGESMSDQKEVLMRGVDVLIATPGRLIDMFDRGSILLTDTRILVIDEADRMLDMGFIPDVERIVSMLPRTRQTLFFSATMGPEIRRLADAFLQNPKEITVSRQASVATTITEGLALVAEHDKREALRRLIRTQKVQNALIFCNRKRDVDILYKSLSKHRFSAGALHGDMAQTVRFATLEKFKAGELQLLVCSDVAARGLDIGGLSHVFNFDVPHHPEDYVHRIGRTGRAGLEGHAFTIASPTDRYAVSAIEKLIAHPIPPLIVEGLDPVDWAEEDGRKRRGKPVPSRRPGGRPGNARPAEARQADQRPVEAGAGDAGPALDQRTQDARVPEARGPDGRSSRGGRDRPGDRFRDRDRRNARSGPNRPADPALDVAAAAPGGDAPLRQDEQRREARRDEPRREDEPRVRNRDEDPRGRSRGDEPRSRNRDEDVRSRTRDEEPRARARDEEPRGRARDDEPRGRARDDEPRGRARDEAPRGRRDNPRDQRRDDRRDRGRRDDDLGPQVRGFGDEVPAFMLLRVRTARPMQEETES